MRLRSLTYQRYTYMRARARVRACMRVRTRVSQRFQLFEHFSCDSPRVRIGSRSPRETHRRTAPGVVDRRPLGHSRGAVAFRPGRTAMGAGEARSPVERRWARWNPLGEVPAGPSPFPGASRTPSNASPAVRGHNGAARTRFGDFPTGPRPLRVRDWPIRVDSEPFRARSDPKSWDRFQNPGKFRKLEPHGWYPPGVPPT